MTERVTLTVNNHVGIIKFNRPEKMNALDGAQIEAILNVADAVQQDASIRAVVLAGEGRAFCAGIDVGGLADGLSAGEPGYVTTRTHGIANRWQQIAWQWREMQVPVIAAVHGVAFGGGLQIMMGADIRIVAPDTKLSIMEMKWGLIPDMAGTQLFRHSVRDDVLRMLTYTHRIFSGEEALGYGFATQVSETPFEDSLALAQEIASKSPSAVVLAKKVLNAAPYADVAEGFMTESILQEQLLGSKNQLESVFAGMQKRAGNFENYRE
ncbi:MAG: crotonase/enoyl-CoA hydratase family protein [Chloroflexota bacterium]